MQGKRTEALIGGIYDAALDSGRWAVLLKDLTAATGARQANLSIMDPDNALTLVAPFWDDAIRRDFLAHYRHQFSLLHRAAHVVPGQSFTYADLTDLAWFRSTALFNEWWLPQGVGGGSLGAKLIGDGRVTAFLTVHAGRGKEGFERKESAGFEVLIPHLIRAVQIQRKLQLAGIRSSNGLARIAAEVAIVDREARLLDSSQQALRRLISLGLLIADTSMGQIVSPDGRLERLIRDASRRSDGGHVDVPRPSGGPIRLTVIPCAESNADLPCVVSIDRPAALIWISEPGEAERARRERLIAAHGLTLAEARVAIEAAKGDGRAAVAARLGIRETTVRAHLSAIFDKTGVRRQAELVRLVQTS